MLLLLQSNNWISVNNSAQLIKLQSAITTGCQVSCRFPGKLPCFYMRTPTCLRRRQNLRISLGGSH